MRLTPVVQKLALLDSHDMGTLEPYTCNWCGCGCVPRDERDQLAQALLEGELSVCSLLSSLCPED